MKIFIIDDDDDVCETLGDILQLHDFEVYTFTNPDKLLSEIDDTVDLVISDVNMPLCNGIDLAEKISIKIGNTEPRVLLMTGNIRRDEIKIAVKKNIYGILQKPFVMEDLFEVIDLIGRTKHFCPCRIKGLISCPDKRFEAENKNPEKVNEYCSTSKYSLCIEYEKDCGERLKRWIEEKC